MASLQKQRIAAPALLFLGIMFPVCVWSASGKSEGAGSVEEPKVEKISIGSEKETVIKVLGDPDGRIITGNITVLFFDEGKVILEKGAVKTVQLRQSGHHSGEWERAMERHQENQENLRERATELKLDKLSDPSFLALPARIRLRYWREFEHRYPGVDVSPEIQNARQEMLAEREVATLRERVAYLERRLNDVERDTRGGGHSGRRGHFGFSPFSHFGFGGHGLHGGHGFGFHGGGHGIVRNTGFSRGKGDFRGFRSNIPPPRGIPNSEGGRGFFNSALRGLPGGSFTRDFGN